MRLATRAHVGKDAIQIEGTMAKGILIAAFDFAKAHEDEFHDWYDLGHLVGRAYRRSG